MSKQDWWGCVMVVGWCISLISIGLHFGVTIAIGAAGATMLCIGIIGVCSYAPGEK